MFFPIGVIINTACIAIGGLLGAWIGPNIRDEFKENLNLIFGVCSMALGIASIVLMTNMSAVVFSVIIGTVVGMFLQLGKRLEAAGKLIQQRLAKREGADNALLVTAIILFCASGTGIYGSIVSGMSGDHSILIAKSILDFFTAMIFACSLGAIVSLIAIPQFLVFFLLFLLANQIMPLTNASMINDFKACGGIIMLANGFRITKLKMFPITEMLPAMILVMPISALWANCIAPLL